MKTKPVSPVGFLALNALAQTYARAADERDVEAFIAIFAPDAELRIYPPEDPTHPRIRRGAVALAAIPDALAKYEKTFHLLGQATYAWSDDEQTATGEVYCEAHHLTAYPDGTRADRVMFIRYIDAYRHDSPIGWKITTREVRIDWIDTRILGA